MILFELCCGHEHRFEGWFRDNAAFDRQSEGGEIACPLCGDRRVSKAPMAPYVARSSRHRSDTGEPRPEAPSEALRRSLERFRGLVEATCDYVGVDFPEEARRIHYRETEPRRIYGEASPEDARELRDEGIDVNVIPWLPRRND